MRETTAIIVGAGHAGLAMSACLTESSIDHVVLERGRVANSWRRERWDSLRLLTPNWQTRLPGRAYQGADPDGYMTAAEVADFVADYAGAIAAPVQTETTVTRVSRTDGGYRVETDRGPWSCRALILASGANNLPNVPAVSSEVPSEVAEFTPTSYGHPGRLPEGGVLVVGAAATGLQLAQEIHASGRPVTLAVGEHVRMPRLYRGRDILWWMAASGVWDERWNEVDDIVRARGVPSPQLVGTPERSSLDLNALTDAGVQLVGRVAGIRDGRAMFSGGLANQTQLADLKMLRLLNTFDEWAEQSGFEGPRPDDRPVETRVPASPRLDLDLRSGEIRSIVWATGFRPDYGWLDVPEALDRKGKLRHEGGVVTAPGLYALGLTFLRRRKSSFIFGAGDDARDLAAHVCGYLAGSAAPAKDRLYAVGGRRWLA
ncbi:MAG: NAD(P)-binding domain-containing protein [Thermoanaerobaculia bacterium]|nr:NAD(P)-binding domain-containing protein [Thermoanaerobaculia bacterium]